MRSLRSEWHFFRSTRGTEFAVTSYDNVVTKMRPFQKAKPVSAQPVMSKKDLTVSMREIFPVRTLTSRSSSMPVYFK